MSEDAPRWKVSLHTSDGRVSRELDAQEGGIVTFGPTDIFPATIVGATIYDENGVISELVANERGELVQAEPGEGIVGAVLSTKGGRWLRRSEVEGDEGIEQ